MKMSEAMTRDVHIATPDQTIRDAAVEMAQLDAGILPVRDGDRLTGMITDRDIAVRAVAKGMAPDTRIGEVMTGDVKYCFEDDEVESVARNMAQIQVRRLPVLDRDKRLVGILSLADMALVDGAQSAGEAIAGISEPGGQHSQTGAMRRVRLGEGRRFVHPRFTFPRLQEVSMLPIAALAGASQRWPCWARRCSPACSHSSCAPSSRCRRTTW